MTAIAVPEELEGRSIARWKDSSMIKKQFVKSRNVTKLTFRLPSDLDADAVHLLAEFNDWRPAVFEKLKDGSWKLTEEVEPGRSYQFRYKVVHGDHAHYLNDPEADAVVPNDQGTENAVVEA